MWHVKQNNERKRLLQKQIIVYKRSFDGFWNTCCLALLCHFNIYSFACSPLQVESSAALLICWNTVICPTNAILLNCHHHIQKGSGELWNYSGTALRQTCGFRGMSGRGEEERGSSSLKLSHRFDTSGEKLADKGINGIIPELRWGLLTPSLL